MFGPTGDIKHAWLFASACWNGTFGIKLPGNGMMPSVTAKRLAANCSTTLMVLSKYSEILQIATPSLPTRSPHFISAKFSPLIAKVDAQFDCRINFLTLYSAKLVDCLVT